VKVRQSGRIVSVATIIALAVNTEGRREVLGLKTMPSEAEPFWRIQTTRTPQRRRVSMTYQCYELNGSMVMTYKRRSEFRGIDA
jgi:transposase-like protein